MKIGVALSGGVDSTAVAYQLKKEGHEVIGLTMQLCPDVSQLPITQKSIRQARPGLAEHGCSQCIAPCACVDGSHSANQLGIRHEIIDFRNDFEKKVITPFVEAFIHGVTPNPCAICNREMKFGQLLDYARELGCEKIATGHYAALGGESGNYFLKRAKDRLKDQTYFMSLVPREKFKFALFPLGEKTKLDVQENMNEKGLQPTHQETSVEICFLRERAYTEFIKDRYPNAFAPGPIVDLEGRQLGEHKGLPSYTIGQRKGLGVAAPQPLYVIRLDVKENKLVVGTDQALWSKKVGLKAINWMMEKPSETIAVTALIRYRQEPVPARLTVVDEEHALIEFDQSVRAITPGQVGAVYCDSRVMAGGIIDYLKE